MISIVEINEQLGTILYSTRDYKNNVVYVVVYGLQSVTFSELEKAIQELNACKEHALSLQ